MSDWREMTGLDLNRVIAERLGYRVEKRKHTIALIRPDGSERIGFGSEDAAWWNVPEYSTDANTHLQLAEGEWFEIHEGWTGHTAARVARTVTAQHGDWQEGATLAEARARAWLDWHDKQKAG